MKRTNLINLRKHTFPGFTLVELLVVIAVIGVLAVAVILAIDPVTKINQAKDSQVQGDISQIANALQSYYTSQAAPSFPTSVQTLAQLTVSGDLKTLPKNPSSQNYTYVVSAAGDKAAIYNAVYNTKNTYKYWCWDSTSVKIIGSTQTLANLINANTACVP